MLVPHNVDEDLDSDAQLLNLLRTCNEQIHLIGGTDFDEENSPQFKSLYVRFNNIQEDLHTLLRNHIKYRKEENSRNERVYDMMEESDRKIDDAVNVRMTKWYAKRDAKKGIVHERQLSLDI